MDGKKRKGLASGLSSHELRECGGDEERREGVAAPDLFEGNGAQKRGQVRS
jgi:hypothetical protein